MPEVQTDHPETAELSKPQLRMVDLNLLTVFDAVMQEQNITRAAHVLGMSQPAVSNAVARLKVMFNDELFVRYGRGIQPTARAFQLFGSVRQALQLMIRAKCISCMPTAMSGRRLPSYSKNGWKRIRCRRRCSQRRLRCCKE